MHLSAAIGGARLRATHADRTTNSEGDLRSPEEFRSIIHIPCQRLNQMVRQHTLYLDIYS